jgi:hypothetical protein
VPLVNQHKAVEGLLLCASRRRVDLQGFADSLGQLGSFVLGQLHLLQRLRQPGRVGHGGAQCAEHQRLWPDRQSAAMRQTIR